MFPNKSFRNELMEQIQDSDPAFFKDCGRTKTDVLADNTLIDRMWELYQQDIEEYGLKPWEAYRYVMEDVLGISATD